MPAVTCPVLDAATEWNAAALAVDAIGESGTGDTASTTERLSMAFDSLHALAADASVLVSRAGATAALELAANEDAAALTHEEYNALAALALRYLRTAAP